MRVRPAEVPQQLGVGAAGVLQRVAQHRQRGEVALVVGSPGQRCHQAAPPGQPRRVEVRYRPAKYRPLAVYLWADPGRVRQELTESQEEYLAGRKGRGVAQVRAALTAVVEVAAVELGLGQLEDIGLVIAGQVAEYVAGVGAGLIRDTGEEWWAVRRGVPKLLLGRS